MPAQPRFHPLKAALLLAMAGISQTAFAQEQDDEDDFGPDISGKLVLTGGVSQIEGSAGGGLTPWAVIGGQGTRDQFGGSAFYTRVNTGAYHLDDYGVLFAYKDRVEFSLSEQRFNTENVGALLGLGQGFTFKQQVIGVKVRVAGEAVLDSDNAMPQISVGIQHKRNNQSGVLAFIGAKDDQGTDFYVSATKLFLAESFLLNGTLRMTRANQIGILGFGGDKNNSYQPQLEASAAWLLNRKLAIGAEYRSKLDAGNLALAVQIAEVPEHIRGYGHVKEAHLAKAKAKEAELLARFRNPVAVEAAKAA